MALQQIDVVPDWDAAGGAVQQMGFEVPGLEDTSKGLLKCSKVKAAVLMMVLLAAAFVAVFVTHRRGAGGPLGVGGAGPFVNTTITLQTANTVDECDVSAESPPVCQHSGTCVDAVGAFACDCVDGYGGTVCASKDSSRCPAINTCDMNHARCTTENPGGAAADASAAACACSGAASGPAFWRQGADCSDVDLTGAWCYTEPGACTDSLTSLTVSGVDSSYLACCGHDGATADCPPAPRLPPPPPPPSEAIGAGPEQSYSCVCHFGYSSTDGGQSCTQDVLCTPTTCLNGGVCEEHVGYTDCRCSGGYTGLSCEVPPTQPFDHVSGMGQQCATDADCGALPGQIANMCHHRAADPTASPPRTAKDSCMVTGCSAGTCPTVTLATTGQGPPAAAVQEMCCMHVDSCSSAVQGTIRSRLGAGDVNSLCLPRETAAKLSGLPAYCSCD